MTNSERENFEQYIAEIENPGKPRIVKPGKERVSPASLSISSIGSFKFIEYIR